MRRRRALSVWPAVADLMTVLAVCGLFGAITLLPHAEAKGDLLERIRRLEREAAELTAQLADRDETIARQEEDRKRREAELAEERREAARNQQMFSAIQQAQELVDRISADESLRFEADQTLRFGDELVSFAPNSLEPRWRAAGRDTLRSFCESLSRHVNRSVTGGRDLRRLFTVQVEGHTDSTRCPGDPHCNWWISAGRAAVFVALMKQEEYCPGGSILDLHPVGYSDTRPPGGGQEAESDEMRRISVRLVPDYRRIIGDGGGPR